MPGTCDLPASLSRYPRPVHGGDLAFGSAAVRRHNTNSGVALRPHLDVAPPCQPLNWESLVPALDTGTDELLCDLDEGVATVTLNKPAKRNALGDVLTPALRAVLLELESDARLRRRGRHRRRAGLLRRRRRVRHGRWRQCRQAADEAAADGGRCAGAHPQAGDADVAPARNSANRPSPRCRGRRPARACPSPWRATCASWPTPRS